MSRIRPWGRKAVAVDSALCFTAPAAAAPIAWSPSQDVADATNIQLTGTLVEAINGTGSGVSAIVNGVTFLASDALLDQSFGGDTLEGGSSGDAALDVLIGSFDYGSATTPTISIGGGLLVPGRMLRVDPYRWRRTVSEMHTSAATRSARSRNRARACWC